LKFLSDQAGFKASFQLHNPSTKSSKGGKSTPLKFGSIFLSSTGFSLGASSFFPDLSVITKKLCKPFSL